MENIKRSGLALAVVLLLVPLACRKAGDTSSTGSATSSAVTQGSTTNLSPEQLGEIGAKISQTPADAKKILSSHGLTEEAFEQAVRKVSSDPDASRRYRNGFRSVRA
jgi:hypothetical protein